jgi:hypothetical protein
MCCGVDAEVQESGARTTVLLVTHDLDGGALFFESAWC